MKVKDMDKNSWDQWLDGDEPEEVVEEEPENIPPPPSSLSIQQQQQQSSESEVMKSLPVVKENEKDVEEITMKLEEVKPVVTSIYIYLYLNNRT